MIKFGIKLLLIVAVSYSAGAFALKISFQEELKSGSSTSVRLILIVWKFLQSFILL